MNVNVLIDSSGWIEHFIAGALREKFSPHIEQAIPHTFITPVIILYEVYKKLKKTLSEEIALRAVAAIASHTTVIPISASTALTAAEISLRLKLSMADALIYTVAGEHGATLVTSDRHFRGLPNVKLIE